MAKETKEPRSILAVCACVVGLLSLALLCAAAGLGAWQYVEIKDQFKASSKQAQQAREAQAEASSQLTSLGQCAAHHFMAPSLPSSLRRSRWQAPRSAGARAGKALKGCNGTGEYKFWQPARARRRGRERG